MTADVNQEKGKSKLFPTLHTDLGNEVKSFRTSMDVVTLLVLSIVVFHATDGSSIAF